VRALASVLAASLALGLLACGPPGRAPLGACLERDGGAGACVELGTGPAATPVHDGADVELVHGPQGGWHLDVGARLLEVAADGLVLAYEVRTTEGAVLGSVRYAINARRLVVDGPYLVRAGDIVILDITDGSEVTGTRVEVEVRLEDAARAVLAADARELVIVDRE
jgi:hypothetical protein